MAYNTYPYVSNYGATTYNPYIQTMQRMGGMYPEQNYSMNQSQQAQTANLLSNLNPTPKPAYITCSPYESVMMNWRGFNSGCGSYNNGCGCGCGCN